MPGAGSTLTADEVVGLLGLRPLAQEGGMWAQTWLDDRSSAICYLLRPGDFSAVHRLAGTEIWHHYCGAAAEVLLLRPDSTVARPVLGPDLAAGQRPVLAVPADTWTAAGTTEDWSLVGTTMAPPFDQAGFELGDADRLAAQYPEAAADIARFTRPA